MSMSEEFRMFSRTTVRYPDVIYVLSRYVPFSEHTSITQSKIRIRLATGGFLASSVVYISV